MVFLNNSLYHGLLIINGKVSLHKNKKTLAFFKTSPNILIEHINDDENIKQQI